MVIARFEMLGWDWPDLARRNKTVQATDRDFGKDIFVGVACSRLL